MPRCFSGLNSTQCLVLKHLNLPTPGEHFKSEWFYYSAQGTTLHSHKPVQKDLSLTAPSSICITLGMACRSRYCVWSFNENLILWMSLSIIIAPCTNPHALEQHPESETPVFTHDTISFAEHMGHPSFLLCKQTGYPSINSKPSTPHSFSFFLSLPTQFIYSRAAKWPPLVHQSLENSGYLSVLWT